MKNFLCAIVSSVPERISRYTQALRPLTTNFLFFSDLHSLIRNRPNGFRLVVVDAFENDPAIALEIAKAKLHNSLDEQVVLVITADDGIELGIDSMEAGADDYVTYGLVSKELALRARLHLSRHEPPITLAPDKEALLAEVKPESDRVVLRQAMHAIQENIGKIKSVQDLSIEIDQTVNAINQVFKIHLNTTVFQYIRQERVEKAKQLLAETRIPITEIAIELGYSTSPNFATAFRQLVGMSPSDYRSSSSVN